MTRNKKLNDWVSWAAALCRPDEVVWIDGSNLEELREKALASGELVRLNQEKLPGCYLHRSAQNDVARSEGKTFICTESKVDAGPTNNWEKPETMYNRLTPLFDGSMKGRTMYVVPYCMGPIESPFAKLGVEITDSIYVVLNMCIMTRVSKDVIYALDYYANFVRGLHSTATLDENNRYICHFPEDLTIWSINSGYGGNALLGKKCFALRIASFQARREGWLAEHMLIIGIENPQGKTHYICAAFPSACGKTNLAMIVPPEVYTKAGYKVWCVGDDIAWLRIGRDGRLWAVNPENGYFGVVPGTSEITNPNGLQAMRTDTIFTNVVYNNDDGTVWWEGLDSNPPENGTDWTGQPWNGKTSHLKGAHPNSRFTAFAKNCPTISPEFDNPEGVPISAIVFGGRRAKTAPLVYQARDFEHGVFIGSIIASETTAAATGAVGVVRRDPMAMMPFCGYNMGDYFDHWIQMGKRLKKKAPLIFNVNWFRTDEEGRFLWPGFRENLRIVDWMIKRCEGSIDAVNTPIGYMPTPEDINSEDLDLSMAAAAELLTVNKELWKSEIEDIRAFYSKFNEHTPRELWSQLSMLEERLDEM
ncbi:MAG: phosphoenolpyruvate carboxykinase (GTP) [Clostridiales bacterium]|nr:phosphoenolpyruvate carboxykinase (GTP) [Clostridiales bacterium]